MRFSFSANSNSPKTTFKVIVLPFLRITKGTDLPTGVPATTLGNSFIVSISMPLNFRITSPVFTPAFWAGPPSVADDTKAPFTDFIPKLSAISFEISWIKTPSQPLLVLPYCLSWSVTCLAKFDETANPIPTEPPDWEKIAVFIPTTFPFMSNNGPPELPLLIEASVWI